MHKRIFLIGFFIFGYASLCNAKEWRITRQEKGVTIQQADASDSTQKQIKGTVLVPASVAAVASMLNDVEVLPLLFPRNPVVGISDQSQHGFLFYLKLQGKALIQDREVYLWTTSKCNEAKEDEIIVDFSAHIPQTIALPSVPQKTVRITTMQGHWRFWPQDSQNTWVEYQAQANIAGNLGLFSNVAVKNLVYSTLRRIYNQAGKHPHANFPLLHQTAAHLFPTCLQQLGQ